MPFIILGFNVFMYHLFMVEAITGDAVSKALTEAPTVTEVVANMALYAGG